MKIAGIELKLFLLVTILIFLTGLTAISQNPDKSTAQLGPWDWGHIRIVRSTGNIEFLKRLHATVNQTGGPIIFPKDKESGEYITDLLRFK